MNETLTTEAASSDTDSAFGQLMQAHAVEPAATATPAWLAELITAAAAPAGRREVLLWQCAYRFANQSKDDFEAALQALAEHLAAGHKRPTPAWRCLQDFYLILTCEKTRHDLWQVPTPAWKTLVAESQDAFVAKLKEHITNLLKAEAEVSGGCFRELCRLARQWGIDPETYRRLLLRAGLTDARASELKSVLACPEVCARFTAEIAPLSWHEALKDSRLIPSAWDSAARRLIRLLVQAIKTGSQPPPATGIKLRRHARGHLHLQTEHGDVWLLLLATKLAPRPAGLKATP